MRSIRRSTALVVVSVALAACGGSDESSSTDDATPTTAGARDDASDEALVTDDGPDDATVNDPAMSEPADDAAVSGPAPGAEPSPDDAAEAPISEDDMFPDVLDATAESTGDTWNFSATLSSPYDTPERYADAWRIIGPDGTVLGERILTHDHASEQPFTRSLSDVEIPDDVDTVTIEGRDLEFGYGGDTVDLTLER